MKNKNSARLKKELLLIGAMLALCVGIIIVRNAGKKPGAYVVISVAGQKIKQLDLSRDAVYNIQTEQGENKLEIKAHKASVVQADCKDKICVHQKAISKTGETIVCLPHKVVVEVIKGAEKKVDAIAN